MSTPAARRVPYGSSRACPVCGGTLEWSKSGFWWCGACGWESDRQPEEENDG